MAALQGRVDDAVPNRVVLVTEQPVVALRRRLPLGGVHRRAHRRAHRDRPGPLARVAAGWRSAGLAFGLSSRVLTAVAVPLNLAITVALGALVGSARAAAIFGSPRRTASRRLVLQAPGHGRVPRRAVEPADVEAGHAQTFVAATGRVVGRS